ncbi:aldehyde dehydrogenase family protein [Brevibacillus fluminis]|uniref:Aldehyde dehydrogenase family protein n=1 Tax=Brevibacillus fluminis TaxID=511487 RepID=A0A3M8DPG6_9BACL|nr:aldehyde dehydrogenase family protein [Brevibacillus fluminis]RNB90030.1 aldehyde dehydrogenase family protein [Brevibacillus fluminis]
MLLKMYVNGEWVDAQNGQTKTVINPATGEVIAHAASGDARDAKEAILAARKAFDEGEWTEIAAVERARYLFAIADELEAQAEEITQLETLDNGKPLRESRHDIADSIACFRYFAGLATKPYGQTYPVPDPNTQALTVREPIGVVGLIVPWNFPLLNAAWKIAPALAAGNTIVFRPSEVTPITSVKLFEIIDRVGLPKGVANLVMGSGRTVGNEMVESHLVDKISFTGGTETGRSVLHGSAGNLKKLLLELGGKSPNIVFADADFATAVDYALFGIFANQGQVCSAGSRLLVEDAIYDRFMEELIARAKNIRVGQGTDPQVEMGPLVSQEQLATVLHYIETGKKEGARLVCGGKRLQGPGYDQGFFVEPTIFTDVTPDMKIVQEEIFGPVLVVQRFRDEAEAIRLANDTVFGLAAGVFTNDGAKALRVIKKVRAGITWVNNFHPAYSEAPWGGYKQSGMGRGLGTYGFDEFTEVKQINISLQVKPSGWFGS